ncbi:MAG: cysteine desulfurase [bacterium]|nr:cysteine desulfurase [bacterium]
MLLICLLKHLQKNKLSSESIVMKRIYLDHAATTPVHPDVISAMTAALSTQWGNPSSLHTEGRTARKAKEHARAQVAQLLQADLSNLYFTASGSEADQWAILGVDDLYSESKGRIITSTIEHSAVRNAAKRLANAGWDVQWLVPDRFGFYSADELQKLMNSETKLVSLMYCNNEIGSIQDISILSNVSHQHGALFHTDAVQALGKLDSPLSWDVDLVSVASHKINGPKGVGALWIRPGLEFPPWIAEASQERGKHAGTEGVPAIVGFGAACQLWFDNQQMYRHQLTLLNAKFMQVLKSSGCEFTLVSPSEKVNVSIVNIRFHRCEAEALLLGFDLAGVAASAGSACASGALKPSGVLLGIGYTEQEANECVRFSFGPSLTIDDVTEGAQRIASVVLKHQAINK